MIQTIQPAQTTRSYTKARICLCSPQPILAAGFRAIAGSFNGVKVEAEWKNVAEVRQYLAELKPDVLLLETTSEVSLDVLAEIMKLAPGIAVVLWVDGIALEFIYQALGVGIRGVLRKNSTVAQYEKCVADVMRGELHIEQSISLRLLKTRQVTLAPRQRVLMGLVAQGLRNKEIAWQMGITEGTVKVYLSHLFDRLGVNDRMELALLALKNTVADQSTAGERRSSARAGKSDFFMPVSMTAEVMGSAAQ